MAKDFSNPNKLGFMRVIQVFFSINVVITIGLLVFLTKEEYNLAFDTILDLVNLIFDGISLWLIWQRKAGARWFIIGFSLFNIVVGSIYNITTGEFDFLGQLILSSSDVILLIYFLTSRRAKAVLTKPFSAETDKEQYQKDRDFYQPGTWAFWRNIIIYFCVFSVVGHWMEAGYCTLIRFGLIPGTYDPNSQIWHDWLYPFVVYGFGTVACILLLFPIKNFLQKHIKGIALPLFLSFAANALACTLIEFAMGMMVNQPLPDGTLPLWDYSDMFCNFMGQVCLQNAVAFGVVATLMTWIVYPGLEGLLVKVPKDFMNIAFVAVAVGFSILYFMYYINIVLPGFDDDDTLTFEEAVTTGGQGGSASRNSPGDSSEDPPASQTTDGTGAAGAGRIAIQTPDGLVFAYTTSQPVLMP